ncbi:MAG: hypothetical protein U0470_05675 [Anaerolineae bacterium]
MLTALHRGISGALGLALVVATLFSAVRLLVMPRATRDPIVQLVWVMLRRALNVYLKRLESFAARDAVMATYAPVATMLLLPTWLALALVGFAGMLMAAGSPTWRDALLESGSSLLTLGFAKPVGPVHVALSFAEATIGLMLVALLIAYLPTMYAAFARREQAVTMLEVRAGSPPSAVDMVLRLHRIGRLERNDAMQPLWAGWEALFADLEESHTTLPGLVFFRSPRAERSWITAAGTVLDGAALITSAVEVPRDAQRELCIRAGYIALRRIADVFRIAYPPDPRFPADSISVARAEFEEALDALAAGGVAVAADRDAAWQAFGGWRVNYDAVLLHLAALVMAPPAPWTSDRSPLAAFDAPRRPRRGSKGRD